jgi:hypothetical protein
MKDLSNNPVLRILWFLMIFQVLFFKGDYPEAFDNFSDYTHKVSSKKTPSSSFLKKILKVHASPDYEDIQEVDYEMEDYTPIGLRYHTEIITPVMIPSDQVISEVGVSYTTFDPDLIPRPPQV